MATSAAHPHLDSVFGEWLKQARKASGLTLDEISRETKIPRRNIEALEHGDLGVMPTFYERAEVRAIARAVGIDEQVAIGQLDAASTPAVEPPETQTADAPWKTLGALAPVALAFGFLLAAVGIGWAVFNSRAAPQPSGKAAAAAAPAPAPAPASASALSVADSPVISRQADVSEPVTRPFAEPMAPAPVAASSTEIVVVTDPPGAHVTVDGISWGLSPVTIRHLSPGAKRVRATKEGFAAVDQAFTLNNRQQQTLNLRLPAVRVPGGGVE